MVKIMIISSVDLCDFSVKLCVTGAFFLIMSPLRGSMVIDNHFGYIISSLRDSIKA
jgi:hypothetical protein